jgi:hypothetical protein
MNVKFFSRLSAALVLGLAGLLPLSASAADEAQIRQVDQSGRYESHRGFGGQ